MLLFTQIIKEENYINTGNFNINSDTFLDTETDSKLHKYQD